MATNATQLAPATKLSGPRSGSEKLPLSHLFEAFCYWAALLLVIATDLIFVSWKLGHSGRVWDRLP